MADPIVVALINQLARRYGVDPAAARAVASVEGGLHYGERGDRGTSFGPFQLHVGGALPRGRGAAWANSPAGLEYAIRQMSRHARGKRGRAAIAAIVSQFERPANIPGEIAKAASRYGIGGGITAPTVQAQRPGTSGAGPVAAPPPPPSGLNPMLGAVVAANNQMVGVPTPMFQFTQPPPASAPRQARSQPPAQQRTMRTRGGRNVNLVRFARGADRGGVKTQPAVVKFVNRIAALAGHPLVIGTGSQHSRLTVNGNVSDHWSGHAADIPATGRQLIRLGQAALIAAGAKPAWARRQRGGLFTLNGHQVIFNTMEGGDHTNHLHVSAY